MNRQQMVSILNTMSEENLLQALSAVGVEAGSDDMDLGDEEVEGLQPWNARDISVEDSNRPQLFDKAKIIKPIAMEAVRPGREYLGDGEEMGELADYTLHAG